jgi:hypothetical protein
MVIGWYRQAVAALVKERLALLRSAPALLAFGSPVVALGSVGWVDRGDLVTLGFNPMLGWFAKPNLGPGRLILFVALFFVAYATLTVAWKPIARLTGWLLLPLGQTALYGYAMQLFLILPLYNLFAVGSEDPAQILRNSVAQAAAVLVVWAMVKRKLLFNIVPR